MCFCFYLYCCYFVIALVISINAAEAFLLLLYIACGVVVLYSCEIVIIPAMLPAARYRCPLPAAGCLAASLRLSLSARLSKYTFILKFVSRWALILFFFVINCTQRQHHYCRSNFRMSCNANEHQPTSIQTLSAEQLFSNHTEESGLQLAVGSKANEIFIITLYTYVYTNKCTHT